MDRVCTESNRRYWPRDLKVKVAVDVGLLAAEGATKKLVYRLKKTD
jgi:hypothetical protein